MYTESIEQEQAFLSRLWKSHNIEMSDGDTVAVGKCPKCQEGTVLTRCTCGEENGYRSWRFDHFCDTCGEQFEIGKITSDIFFHKPYETIDRLETPFGDIHVTVNEKQIPFRHRIETYKHSDERPVTLHLIDIDFSDLKIGDTVFCGFNKSILQYFDGDERSVIHSCEDSEQILGLCAYEPDDETSASHCYQLDDYSNKGFGYIITADPHNYDSYNFYQSKITSLAVSWLKKADYEDAELTTFLALTDVIF